LNVGKDATGYHISDQFLSRGAVIVLVMEAENTFETSVNFYQITRRNISGDNHFRTAVRT
jgi:hypothetical protein